MEELDDIFGGKGQQSDAESDVSDILNDSSDSQTENNAAPIINLEKNIQKRTGVIK